MTRTVQLRRWQKAALDGFVASPKRDFLAVATPGAGKTTFALTAAPRARRPARPAGGRRPPPRPLQPRDYPQRLRAPVRRGRAIGRVRNFVSGQFANLTSGG